MTLTLQVLQAPQNFLQAIGDVDNVSTNLAVGAARDASQRADSKQKSIWMILHGQCTDEDRTIQISHNSSLTGQSTIWIVCCSHNLETYFIVWSKKDARILPMVSLIVETIVKALVTDKAPPVHSVMGPKLLSEQLLAAWGSSVDPPLTIREQPFLTTCLAYVTSSEWAEIQQKRQSTGQNEVLDVTTLKYDRNLPEIQSIRSQLVQCILGFWGNISEEGAGPAAEKLVDELLDKGEAGRLWIWRATEGEIGTSETEIAGYLFMGRETKNTVAIRNVYTKDTFRGRGVAKELVAAACGWWLLEADGDKKKQAVTLFVEPENPAAVRTYLRSGFRIEEEPWERRGFNGVSMGAF